MAVLSEAHIRAGGDAGSQDLGPAMGSPIAEKISAAAAGGINGKKVAGLVAAFVFVAAALIAAIYLPWSPPDSRANRAPAGIGDGANTDGGGSGADEDASPSRAAFKSRLKSFQSELAPALE